MNFDSMAEFCYLMIHPFLYQYRMTGIDSGHVIRVASGSAKSWQSFLGSGPFRDEPARRA
jgi:hypothetical protein